MSRRTFSRTFNRDLVRRVSAGAARPAHLCRADAMSPGTLSQWCNQYAVRGDTAVTPCPPAHRKHVQ